MLNLSDGIFDEYLQGMENSCLFQLIEWLAGLELICRALSDIAAYSLAMSLVVHLKKIRPH